MEKNKKTATKKTATSFSISDEAKRLLTLLAEKKNRSKANMLETLIFESCATENIV
jgi:predicted transcriptional regulator